MARHSATPRTLLQRVNKALAPFGLRVIRTARVHHDIADLVDTREDFRARLAGDTAEIEAMFGMMNAGARATDGAATPPPKDGAAQGGHPDAIGQGAHSGAADPPSAQPHKPEEPTP